MVTETVGIQVRPLPLQQQTPRYHVYNLSCPQHDDDLGLPPTIYRVCTFHTGGIGTPQYVVLHYIGIYPWLISHMTETEHDRVYYHPGGRVPSNSHHSYNQYIGILRCPWCL